MAIPKPITRVEQYLAHISGMRVNVPEAPLTREERYLAAWAKKSGIEDAEIQGDPPLTLKDCIGEPFKGLVLYGKSTQVTTTGAQLLDIPDAERTIRGVTLRVQNGVIEMNGTATESGYAYMDIAKTQLTGTYTLSIDGAVKGALLDDKLQRLIESTASLNGETARMLTFYITKDVKYSLTGIKVMLNAGNTALPWEPYTGGKPSPSPDYPQEIVSSKGNLTVRGKNLYNPSIQWTANGWGGKVKNTQNKVTVTASNGWTNASFLSPAKGETVTFSCTYKQTETTSEDTIHAFAIVTTSNGQYPNNNNNGVICYETSSPSTKEATVSATFVSDTYIGIFLRVDPEGTGLTRTVELTNIQLEYDSKATSYEPYHEPQSMSVTTPNGLPGIPASSGGNYTDGNGQQWICDEVDFGRGMYVQRIEYKEYSDASKWAYRLTARNKNNNFQTKIFGVDIGTDKNYPTQCNLLPYKNQGWDDNAINLPKIYAYNQEITVSFPPNSDINSIDKWDELLKKKL